jgi:hypothetical protein
MGVNPNTKIANRVTDLKGKGVNEPSGGSKLLSHPGKAWLGGSCLPGTSSGFGPVPRPAQDPSGWAAWGCLGFQ